MRSRNFLKILEEYKKPVWEEIKKYLPKTAEFSHAPLVNDYPLRQGKYFRPALVLLANELYGGKKSNALLTAASMQISEDWLLIHDDVEDHSKTRRKKPTLHELHGNELAINAGDALHTLMWKMLGDNVRQLGPKKGWQVYDKLNHVLMTTTEGQHMELSWSRRERVGISEKEYYRMIYKKSGYYTVTAPLQLGAIVAGAGSNTELKKIESWGIPFGCAFQIWDDLLDATNKGRGDNDVLEGKRTLLLIHLLKHCSSKEKSRIESIYKQVTRYQADSAYVTGLMKKYGSIDYAKKVAKNFALTAEKKFLAHTQNLPDSESKQTIRLAIQFVASREY